jgi:NAD(P)-dependent dehydrogenase (short-subunit alcohol dehydrogenase family)
MCQPTIIVTGASQGLGAVIASMAASRGANVVLTARSASLLEAQVQRISQRGEKALAVVADISRLDDCQKIVDTALQAFGRIDALINNAGTIEPLAPIVDGQPDYWAYHMAVNVLGPVMMCQLAIPLLRQTGGRVINVTSHAAEIAIPGAAAYSTSKAALNRFSKVLAVEEPSITVVLFIPGEVDTAMQGVIREKGRGQTPDEVHQFFVDLYEQKKLLPPEAPALAAVNLALKAPLEWSGDIIEWDDVRVRSLV